IASVIRRPRFAMKTVVERSLPRLLVSLVVASACSDRPPAPTAPTATSQAEPRTPDANKVLPPVAPPVLPPVAPPSPVMPELAAVVAPQDWAVMATGHICLLLDWRRAELDEIAAENRYAVETGGGMVDR